MASRNRFLRVFTHEGARARRFTPEDELRRSLMNCLLWEDQFYEDGVSIAERMAKLVPAVAPDNLEVSLSSGKDKRETFERLIGEKKLGGLALLRNLRLMQRAEVPRETIAAAIEAMRTDRILPYRFIAAARYAPDFEPELESAMLKSLQGHAELSGATSLLIDVSASMDAPLSGQSEMTRLEAACGLAILAREVCETVEIFTFSSEVVKV